MDVLSLLSAALLLYIMIDPTDKILLLGLLREDYHLRDLFRFTLRANALGFVILATFALAGQIILQDIFHIDINALKLVIAGPAAITTVITFAVKDGILFAFLVTLLAVLAVAATMLLALRFTERVNKKLLSTTVRLMGLFIMAIGAQMAVEGFAAIFASIVHCSA